MKYVVYILLLIVLAGCKSTLSPNYSAYQLENTYRVKKKKKEKNNVYVIYATRNDSTFKICTYYDNAIPVSGRKVKKGDNLNMKMYSQFRATELKFKMMPVCNVAFDFHNVVISRGKYDDVLICHELNGLYYK